MLYAATADTLTDQTGTLRIYDIAVPGGTGIIDFVEEPRELKTLRVDVNDASSSGATDAVYPTRMALREDGIVYIAQTSIGAPAGAPAVGEESRLTKVNPDIENEIVWAIDTYDGDEEGGIGMGVVLGPKDSSGRYTIYSVGADISNSGASDDTAVRRIVDDGSSALFTGEAWTANLAADFPAVAQPEAARLRLAADTDGTLYVPSSDNSDSCVLIFEKDGTLIGGDGQIGTASAGGAILNVAVPKTKPTYDSSIPLTEFVVYGGTADTSNDALFRVDVVSTTQVANLAPRSLSIIATTANGALRLITDSGVQTPATADEDAPDDVVGAFWRNQVQGHLHQHWADIVEQYDTIVVDEVQDFSQAWLAMLETLLDPDGPRRFLLVGDANQELYKTISKSKL